MIFIEVSGQWSEKGNGGQCPLYITDFALITKLLLGDSILIEAALRNPSKAGALEKKYVPKQELGNEGIPLAPDP
jgi:hypothetical protein